MVKVMVEFEVADFARWKAGFDSGEGLRKNAGVTGVSISRGLDKPNRVQVVMEGEDEKKLMMLNSSPELRDLQVKSGVMGRPSTYMLHSI